MQEANLDRFAQGFDADYYRGTDEAWAVCEGCGCDICDDAIEMPDGGYVHEEMECVMKYPGVKRRVG